MIKPIIICATTERSSVLVMSIFLPFLFWYVVTPSKSETLMLMQ
jgi:hypothetical protein